MFTSVGILSYWHIIAIGFVWLVRNVWLLFLVSCRALAILRSLVDVYKTCPFFDNFSSPLGLAKKIFEVRCTLKPETKSRPERNSNPWPLRYRCSALPTELSSHLGAGHSKSRIFERMENFQNYCYHSWTKSYFRNSYYSYYFREARWPRPRSERSGFEPWPGRLYCVLGQDTSLSQCLSPPRSINWYR